MNIETVTYQGVALTRKALEEETPSKLAELYNKVAHANELPTVKRFSDKQNAVRRTWDLLGKYGRSTKKVVARSGERKFRKKRFNFVAIGEPRRFKEGTLRADFIHAMRGDGITFDGAMAIVRAFDKRRRLPEKNVEVRAYEGMRLIHYYVNMSMRQDEETGIIKIVPNRKS